MKSIVVMWLSAWLWTGMFWNLENFFDYFDDGCGVSDAEFSPRGGRHWTRKRFDAKTEMVGKTLLWAGAPDVVGVCEVENAGVLRRLCGSDALRKLGYRHVHYESLDPRGIDVGLLYRSDRMRVERSRRVRVTVPAGSGPVAVDTLKTRDILYVCLEELDGCPACVVLENVSGAASADVPEAASGRRWHILVNHHPSKYGGSRSGARRQAVMRCMLSVVDSVLHADPGARIVCMGDFNDTPFSPAMTLAANHVLPASETGKQAGLVNLGAWLQTGKKMTSTSDNVRKLRSPTPVTDTSQAGGCPQPLKKSEIEVTHTKIKAFGDISLSSTSTPLPRLRSQGRSPVRSSDTSSERHPAPAGTIRFQGKWELIDNFLVTPNVDSICHMTILQPPFLMERDRKYPGMKPKRTYIGPRYNGGVSDHLPIMLGTTLE